MTTNGAGSLPYRKKLIEVALPLKAINEASAREKSIRHGHPSTLHLWWARRPLAACRAVLFASLVDDPDSDPAYRNPDGTVDEERAGIKRAELFNLIEELVRWENSSSPRVINAARAEIARCIASRKIELGELAKEGIVFGEKKGHKHPKGAVSGDGITAWEVLLMKAKPDVVNSFLAEHAPPILDPFCGGGSIPLEAQRLGLRAYASDLNPVPVLITKALIEIPPKFAGQPPVNPEWQQMTPQEKAAAVWQGAAGLAEDVRHYGQWMRDEAEKRIGHLYPKVKITADMAHDRPDLKPYLGQALTVIAWLWARTVKCPNPACGISMPLVRGFWLSTKRSRKAWLYPVVSNSTVSFEVRCGTGEPVKGTVNRRGATCIACGTAVPFDYIRAEGQVNRVGVTLMSIVCEGRAGQIYLPAQSKHVEIASTAQPDFVPDTSLPVQALGFRVQRYGLTRHADLFSSRQLCLLGLLTNLVAEARAKVSEDSRQLDATYIDAVTTYLAITVSKFANRCSTLTFWDSGFTKIQQTFARQALSMIWDWIEVNPFSDSTGCFVGQLGNVTENIAAPYSPALDGHAFQLDAAQAFPDVTQPIFSTDPPYYDNINYAELSDFFYIWLRCALREVYPQLFSTVTTPKSQQLVAEPGMFNGEMAPAIKHFEQGLTSVFERMRAVATVESPTTVFYAFKQQEADTRDEDQPVQTVSTGWEKMLEAVRVSGFSVSGTWPIRTEQAGGLRVEGRNALASSIVLVCRLRPEDAPLATRKEFMNALRRELPESLVNLQHGNIAPVDLAQAAIGPGMSVFTRYAKVIETDGSAMSVRTALGIINQVLDEVLAEQEGEFDAETRWALAWFQEFGMSDGPFGVAETLSKAKNTAVGGLVEAGVVKARSGKVQLVPRVDLADGWDPATDRRLTVWETTQHLIRVLETQGESEAATLLNKLGGMAEIARELAYRLYSICERKKWADEALAYNGLVIAWPELTKLAQSQRSRRVEVQREMFSRE